VPIREHRRIKSHPAKAVRSPTLVGCALAVEKKNFLATGSFDTGLKIWGGENLELAFRTWMCGGEVLTAPCSRVGHVFKVQTYGFEGEKAKVVKRNSMRVAEVWMDDYKRFFYAATSQTEVPLEDAGIESIEERKLLKGRLQCNDFQWYLDNVFPDLQKPTDDVMLYGDVTNTHSDACLKPDPKTGYVILSGECYAFRIQPTFEFYIDTNSRLKYREMCVDFGNNLLLKIVKCEEVNSQRAWSLRVSPSAKRTGKIVASTTEGGVVDEYCLNHVTNVIEPYKDEQMPQMNECKEESKFQIWSFMYHMDQSILKRHNRPSEL
jgi:polypeptide N-acetylgalactosaminyltransferase